MFLPSNTQIAAYLERRVIIMHIVENIIFYNVLWDTDKNIKQSMDTLLHDGGVFQYLIYLYKLALNQNCMNPNIENI